MGARIGYNFDMVAAIRQTVTVGEGGVIEVRSPELRPGARAEVIVLVEQAGGARRPLDLAALDALQESLKLNSESAAAWMAQVAAERKAYSPPEQS